jgi:hypothetical protein
MMDILNSYLVQHKSISIPGLGTLYVEDIPAQSDFTNRQVIAPSYQYRFDKYFDAPDKDFFSWLALQKSIPDFEAIKQYNEFAYELRNNIRTKETASWQHVGVFKKDEHGEILFESFNKARNILPPAIAERVIHKNAQHSILVGDIEKTNLEMTEILHDDGLPVIKKQSWWLYAVIIAAVAICVIFFYTCNKGWRPRGFGNQQKINTER